MLFATATSCSGLFVKLLNKMEPLLNVTVTTEYMNDGIDRTPRVQKFKPCRLAFEKAEVPSKEERREGRRIWHLVIGGTPKKKIQVTGNVLRIHKDHVFTDGKATIQFRNPSMYCFLSTVTISMEARKDLQRLLSNVIQVCKGNAPSVVKKKISPLNKVDFSSESNTWHKLKLLFQLPDKQLHITSLELEGKQLTELPKEISTLGLVNMKLGNNFLGLHHKEWWEWLDGKLLLTLQSLCLDDNKLTKFPVQILNAKKLSHLSLKNNSLEAFPDGLVRRGSPITHLYLSYNTKLKYLPVIPSGVIHTLDTTGCSDLFDISAKRFQLTKCTCRTDGVPDLLELAGNRVLQQSIPHGLAKLPRNLNNMLNNAKLCKNCHRMRLHANSSYKFMAFSVAYSSVQNTVYDHVGTPVCVRENSCTFCRSGGFSYSILIRHRRLY